MVYKAKGMIAAMYNIQKIKVLEHAKKILEKLLEEWLKKVQKPVGRMAEKSSIS